MHFKILDSIFIRGSDTDSLAGELSFTVNMEELPALGMSILALLALIFLDGMIREKQGLSMGLQGKEREFDQLIETANTPIFGVDTEGRVNKWNRTAAQITGYSKDEVMGKKLEEFITAEQLGLPVATFTT